MVALAKREGQESEKEEKEGMDPGQIANIPIAVMASHLGSALEVTGKTSKEEAVT